VYIEWCDAINNAGWFDDEEAKEWADKTEWVIRHAGWLIREDKESITIASGWKPADSFTVEKFLGLEKIPKTWIRKRVDLTKHVK